MGHNTVFICSSTRRLDYFKVSDSETAKYTDSIDKMMQHFPGLDEANPRGWSDNPIDRYWNNVVLGFRKQFIDFMVYDSELNSFWQWDSVNRLAEGKVVLDFLLRKMRLYMTEERATDSGPVKETRYVDYDTEGPQIIVVDSSELSNRRRPTGKSVKKLVNRIDPSAECVILQEPGQYRNIRRALYKLPAQGGLDAVNIKGQDIGSDQRLDNLIKEAMRASRARRALRES